MTPRHKFYIVFFIGGLIVCAGLHAFACEIGRDETGNDAFEMKICVTNNATCDPQNDPNGNCEDIPVIESQPGDYEEPLTPDEQWAALVAWREQGE